MRRWLRITRLRFRSIAHRGRLESDLDRELAFHLEQEADANRQLGLTPAEARTAALRRLGGVAQIQEECRDMRRTNYIENFTRDLQYAVRTLAKSPGFTAMLVLTLALSIGANSAIFGVIDGVLLRPLPYPHSDRIVRIFFRSATYPKFPLNPFDLRDMRARNRAFDALAGMTRVDRLLSGSGEPQRLRGFRVTADYFRVLGVAPARGREFNTKDELPANGDIAVLSDRLWRARFASDPDIVGRKIMIDANPFTVVGVMPPGVPHPGNDYHSVADGDTVDIWTPFTFQGDGSGRGSHYIEGIARLRPGVSLAQAQADLDGIVAQLGREHPAAIEGWHGWLVPLYDEMVQPSRRLLLVLLGAVGLVLLIACANAANLLLARATARRREIAVRAALGAGRGRLVRQMLAESFAISVAAAGLGALLAIAGVKALTSLLPAGFPRAESIQLDAGVFAFTLAAALAAGFLFGLAPAWQAARTDLQQGLREGARGSTSSGGQVWFRGALVVGEIGLACLLLIGAGLMLRSFVNLLRTDPGFRPERVITAGITLPDATYKRLEDLITFFDRLRGNLRELPGVHEAGFGTDLPWTGYDENAGGFTIEGRQPPPNREFHARYHAADAGYFAALGVPLIRGRFFDSHDSADSRRVMIINRAMARAYWGSDDAVGGRLSFDDHPKEKDWFTVVGVVGDVKDHPNSPSAEPAMWWPILQMPWRFTDMSLVLRTNGNPADAAGQIRDAVHRLNPNLAVAEVRPMDDVAGQSFSTPRFGLFLVALFAALAVILAAMGIYGVISYSVGQRTQEFGVRVALGARSWDIVRQVMSQGLKLAAAGIVFGIAGALLLGRLLRALLYEVKPTDPTTYILVALAAAAIAAIACYIPARRATHADPMTALRAE
jgi:predicted permease